MSSILIKVGTSNTSPVVGKLSVNDAESCSNGVSSDGQPSSLENFRREIRIVLENQDEEVYRHLWQLSQQHSALNVEELKILPDEIGSKSGRTWVRSNGKLSYDSQRIDFNGTFSSKPKYLLNSLTNSRDGTHRILFRGYHEYSTPVAIERIGFCSQKMTEIEREFQILQELEIHENFIRYFSYEMDDRNDFVFIATELCLCSVADLLAPNRNGKIIPKEEIIDSLTPKGILFQATRGLDYLHQNYFVHRNVKPSSFLIKEVVSRNGTRYAIKITDFRLTRQLDPSKDLSGKVASDGWEAPESRNPNQPLRQSLDVFILGCFYYFVLTGTKRMGSTPSHPFGDGELSRVLNIPNVKYLVYQRNWRPKPSNINDEQACSLIKRMIEFKETERPTLTQVLDDEYFNPSKREFYPIYNHAKPGLCVIFNQKCFHPKTRLPRRDGTDQDCAELKYVFKNFGFDVVVHHDLTSFDLRNEMKKLASKDFSNYGCLTVCILSHGIENAIAGYDGRWINLNKIKYKFAYNSCPSLYGKPKMFIIQACQGVLEQNQIGVVPTGVISSDANAEMNPESTVQLSVASSTLKFMENYFNKALNPNAAAPNQNPPIMDFITIKSTIPGFVSLRNSVTGTYFIQALCQKLKEEYLIRQRDESSMEDSAPDLEEILRGDGGVQSIVNCNIRKSDYRQTVSWEAYLSKYIRFRRSSISEMEEDETDTSDGLNYKSLEEKYSFLAIFEDENTSTP